MTDPSKEITLWLELPNRKPRPWKRPRVRQATLADFLAGFKAKPQIFTDPSDSKHRAELRAAAWGEAGRRWLHGLPAFAPAGVPVRLHVDFLFKGKRPGDLSNYLKAVEDAVQGVFFENDKQIVGPMKIDDHEHQSMPSTLARFTFVPVELDPPPLGPALEPLRILADVFANSEAEERRCSRKDLLRYLDDRGSAKEETNRQILFAALHSINHGPEAAALHMLSPAENTRLVAKIRTDIFISKGLEALAPHLYKAGFYRFTKKKERNPYAKRRRRQ